MPVGDFLLAHIISKAPLMWGAFLVAVLDSVNALLKNTSSVGSADTFPSKGKAWATASTQGEGNWDAAQVSGAFAFPSRSRRGRWHRQVTDEVSPDHLPSGKLLIKRWKPCKAVGNVRRAGFAGTPLKGKARATASTQAEGNWDAAQVSGAFAFPSRSRRGRWHRQVTDEVSPDHLPSGKLLSKGKA